MMPRVPYFKNYLWLIIQFYFGGKDNIFKITSEINEKRKKTPPFFYAHTKQMAETLSPNPKQRGPFSPSSPFFLGSNDDKLERAQARAARAAAVRRKPAAPTTATSPKADPLLGKEQILELFQNCIKLASENVFPLFYFIIFCNLREI